MSGADLANVINEAALLTARENGTVITGAALEEAVDRVVGGPRRKSRIISEHEKKITAYHEGGHTLAAWAMPDIEPIYKVTILARGRTGGHAMSVPEDDKGLMTRSEMIARLVFAMGGRAAEELVFREPTTGASSDIDQATKIARAMVTEYGMSSKLGAVRYGTEHGDPFLGRTMGTAGRLQPRGRADHRRRGAQAHRGRAHRGVGDPHRVPRRARHPGRRAAGEGDAAPRRAAGHLRRREEAPAADHVRRLRWPRPVGQAARSRRRASWRSSAASRGRKPVPEPAFKAAIAQAAQGRAKPTARTAPTAPTANGAPANGPTQPDYGAPAGWHAPGWPPHAEPAASQSAPQQHPQGYWYPPPPGRTPTCPRRSGSARPTRRISPTRSQDNRAPQGAPHPRPNQDPGHDRARTTAGLIRPAQG